MQLPKVIFPNNNLSVIFFQQNFPFTNSHFQNIFFIKLQYAFHVSLILIAFPFNIIIV